jgi:hypothetical protein
MQQDQGETNKHHEIEDQGYALVNLCARKHLSNHREEKGLRETCCQGL